MESPLSLFRMHWDQEPRRSGVSGERRWKWFRGLAALCRGAATERRFMERFERSPRTRVGRRINSAIRQIENLRYELGRGSFESLLAGSSWRFRDKA